MGEHNRRVGESIDDYMIRLFENMNIYNLKCQEIADLLNMESGDSFSESRWRKRFKIFTQGRMYERKAMGNDLLVTQARELEKQKIMLAEQRAAVNRAIREDAKRDAVFDEIRLQFSSIDPISLKINKDPIYDTDGTLIVALSDLHIGIEFNNQYGHYNTEIAKARLEEYAIRVMTEAKNRSSKNCIVALLGDLVSGVSYATIRIENRENYVEQIKTASELVSQFVALISNVFEKVDVYGVGGNHSRAVQNEKDALVAECFDNLIPWYMSARLQSVSNVVIHSEVDVAGMTRIDILGKSICLVHGHLDAVDEKSIARLNSMCHVIFDYVLCGHMHECEYKSVLGIQVIRCGCLCGSGDEYTLKNRLSGRASQMIVSLDSRGEINAIIPVVFD